MAVMEETPRTLPSPSPATDLHDPYAPKEMAARVQAAGVKKANLDTVSIITLGVLAGAFIALGAQIATVVASDSTLGYGPTRMVVGIAFSLGLILVIIAGAELFTGNTLIVMAWLSKRVSTAMLLRNWALVYVANFVGAIATAWLVYLSSQWKLHGSGVGLTALDIARSKSSLSFGDAFFRGILCNALVCLAVWLCFSARSNVDKVFTIIPPIAAFVAAGFEHSIANMYFIPIGLMLKGNDDFVATAGAPPEMLDAVTWDAFLVSNLLPVTLGNIIGGGVMVAAIYWLVYLRPSLSEAR